ncbi:MAG TPA: acylphosphatase [Thermodesulfobacteriota bacterium]
MRRVRVRVHGRVQGVGFRWSAVETAHALGVRGYVRNLPDGDVEAVVEGEAAAVERMLDWLRRGPRHAHVTGVTVTDEPYTGEFPDFSISR